MNTISNRFSIVACIVCCAICASLTSCSLDENPRDQIPEEEAYTSASALFQNTVATLYNYIGGSEDGQGLQGTCRGIYDLQTFGSDEAMLPTRGGDWYDGGLWQDMYCHSWSAGHDLPKNAWLYLYKVITLCNRSLEQIEAHKSLLTDSQTKSYKAEVCALRAIYYWYLLDLFGNVPLVTSSEVSMNNVMQSESSEVFNFVVRELKEACPYIAKDKSVRRGDYYGRVTQPVAYFVLAKLMLNAPVYSKNAAANPSEYYSECIEYCNLIEDSGYILEFSYTTNFSVQNEISNENIWTIPMDKNLYSNQQQNMYRSYHYRHAAAYGFTGENGSCATKRVLDIFGYGTDEEDTRFKLNYWADVVTDLNGNTVLNRSGQPLVYYPREVDLDISGSKYVETAGARMKKYEIDKNAVKDGKLMDNDIVLFRFADVLLMRAEARLRLDAVKGESINNSLAYVDLNAVRARVDMPPRPATLQNILDERLLELCWEGWRRQDLIRFGQYKTLYEGSDKPVETDGHTTIFPIPADVMALNHNLVQNPGY